MDDLNIVPEFGKTGLRLDVFLDGGKVGRIDKYDKEIRTTVKLVTEADSNMEQDLPYDQNWGPINCSKYPSGKLRTICEKTGNDANTNCVRKCLQDKYPDSYKKAPR